MIRITPSNIYVYISYTWFEKYYLFCEKFQFSLIGDFSLKWYTVRNELYYISPKYFLSIKIPFPHTPKTVFYNWFFFCSSFLIDWFSYNRPSSLSVHFWKLILWRKFTFYVSISNMWVLEFPLCSSTSHYRRFFFTVKFSANLGS